MTDIFNAYRIGASSAGFVRLTLNDLDDGGVVIRACYSSVNYKDALAAMGAGKVVRRFPCVGGVDVAGVVAHSTDPRFKAGDEVLVTGYGMSVDHDGGYAEYVRVPADWVVTLPDGLSMFEAMALGTAGFTAALAVHRLEQNDLSPGQGKVLVTGATGGVSSWVIQMLAQRGYHVVAMTRKQHSQDYLQALGAAEILLRERISFGSKPLESALWTAAFDSVGGETLAWLTRTMAQSGVIAAYGNTGGVELHTTVLPFILRGVRLIGIDSAATQMPVRSLIWQRLAQDLKPQKITPVVQTVPFAELPSVFPRLLNGELQGRVVISIS